MVKVIFKWYSLGNVSLYISTDVAEWKIFKLLNCFNLIYGTMQMCRTTTCTLFGWFNEWSREQKN